jgi:sterol desaturase/sphingolipid hydroxylase (fatty acid hydroxylase superfamily)
MEKFPYLQAAIMAGFFFGLLGIERIRPLRSSAHPRLPRIAVNLILSALAFVAGMLSVRPAAQAVMAWASNGSFGLLFWARLPFWARLILGFLWMDLTFYYWHRMNHEIPFLWRFHNVHHVDTELDVTTSFRFHFVEVLLSSAFRAVQVGLFGISVLTYAAFELVFQCATLFHHSNVRLPLGLERLLNHVVVTPRMHSIHHSIVREETNSNYSVIFRWWDALHRSLRLNVPQGDITIGVPAYRDSEKNRLWNLLGLPLRKQLNYWQLPNGSRPRREAASGTESRNTLLR